MQTVWYSVFLATIVYAPLYAMEKRISETQLMPQQAKKHKKKKTDDQVLVQLLKDNAYANNTNALQKTINIYAEGKRSHRITEAVERFLFTTSWPMSCSNATTILFETVLDQFIQTNPPQKRVDYRSQLRGRYVTPLMLAVYLHSEKHVTEFLQAPRDVIEEVDDFKHNVMFYCRSLSIGKLLIENVLDVEPYDRYKRTPLFYCCPQMVPFFLDNDYAVDSKDKDGNTSLFLATTSLLKVKALLKCKATVDVVNHKGQTVLVYMAEHCLFEDEQLAVAQLVIEKGLSLFVKDGSGMTAWDYLSKRIEIDERLNRVVQKLCQYERAVLERPCLGSTTTIL